MTEEKIRFVIALISLALRDERLPSRLTDQQTNKEHVPTGSFSTSSFDFNLEDGMRIWGQRTSSELTAYIDNRSQKFTMDYSGRGQDTKVSKAKDEVHSVEYTQIEYQGQTVIVTSSSGRFKYYA